MIHVIGKFGHLGLISFKNSIISTDIFRLGMVIFFVFYTAGLQISKSKAHQMSIIVIPGLIQLLTYCRTCRWASAASRKSFHMSSLALSIACFSSLLILQAALRLRGPKTLYDVASTFIYLDNNHYHINSVKDGPVNVSSSHYLDFKSL